MIAKFKDDNITSNKFGLVMTFLVALVISKPQITSRLQFHFGMPKPGVRSASDAVLSSVTRPRSDVLLAFWPLQQRFVKINVMVQQTRCCKEDLP